MSQSELTHSPPPLPLAFLEAGRALGEMSSLPAGQIFLRSAPKGDGHPVVVCPGFLTSDGATGFLRRFIRSKDYRVYGWKLGRNMGPGTVGPNGQYLREWVESVYRQHERPVSLVGWSLGGVLARELAKQAPEMVRQVITLGSPLTRAPSSTNVSWIYNGVGDTPLDSDMIAEALEHIEHPPEGVPSTSIFSKTDGIVPWRASLESETPLTDNIEVFGSHCGLGVNPFVYFAIADRLALPDGEWTPFNRKASAWRRAAYPSSGHGYDAKIATD